MPRFSAQSNSLYGRVPAPAWVTPSGAGWVDKTPQQLAALSPADRVKYDQDRRRAMFRTNWNITYPAIELTPQEVLGLSPAMRTQYTADRLLFGDGTISASKQAAVPPSEIQRFAPVMQQAIGITGDVLLAAINGADLNERETIRARTQIRLAEIAADSGRPAAPGEVNALNQTNGYLSQQPSVGPTYGNPDTGMNKTYLYGGIAVVLVVGGIFYMQSQKRSNPVVRLGKKRSKKFIPAAKLRQLRAKRSRSRSRSR